MFWEWIFKESIIIVVPIHVWTTSILYGLRGPLRAKPNVNIIVPFSFINDSHKWLNASYLYNYQYALAMNGLSFIRFGPMQCVFSSRRPFQITFSSKALVNPSGQKKGPFLLAKGSVPFSACLHILLLLSFRNIPLLLHNGFTSLLLLDKTIEKVFPSRFFA